MPGSISVLIHPAAAIVASTTVVAGRAIIPTPTLRTGALAKPAVVTATVAIGATPTDTRDYPLPADLPFTFY